MGRLEDLRINAYLSEVARGYGNNSFIAENLFPIIDSEKEKIDIFQFNKETFDKRAAEIQAMATQRAQSDYGCARCMIRELCKGGCMAAAYLSTGDPLSCDGDCQLRKRQFLDFRM